MNERLKQLMQEAGYAAPELAGRANKLAELIVQECADLYDKSADDWFGTDTKYILKLYAERIKKHFGVV
jgi:hypothetical protein